MINVGLLRLTLSTKQCHCGWNKRKYLARHNTENDSVMMAIKIPGIHIQNVRYGWPERQCVRWADVSDTIHLAEIKVGRIKVPWPHPALIPTRGRCWKILSSLGLYTNTYIIFIAAITAYQPTCASCVAIFLCRITIQPIFLPSLCIHTL